MLILWNNEIAKTAWRCAQRLLDRDALATEIVLEVLDELQLLLDREATDDRLKYGADGNVMLANEAAIIDVDKHAHQEPGVRVTRQHNNVHI